MSNSTDTVLIVSKVRPILYYISKNTHLVLIMLKPSSATCILFYKCDRYLSVFNSTIATPDDYSDTISFRPLSVS